MGDKTGISWTDATWNPIRGCSRVSEGCRHCYAETIAGRFSGVGQPYHGLATRRGGHGKWTGVVRVIVEHLADPLRWKRPRRIFVNSMSDLFHEALTNEQIAAVFSVMAACPQHTFQVLTKRARRMREWFEWAREEAIETGEDVADYGLMLAGYAGVELGDGSSGDESEQQAEMGDRINDAWARPGPDGGTVWDLPWPLPNVWLGVSVENQEAAEERIPELLRTPAAVRFLSCEPLIGPVDLDIPRCDHEHHGPDGLGLADDGATPWCNECDSERSFGHWLNADGGIDWVIAGCESGNYARSCSVEWLRSLRDQCAAADVPYFLKQAEQATVLGNGMTDGAAVVGVGDGSHVKSRGIIELPYLDGVQHAAFPVPR